MMDDTEIADIADNHNLWVSSFKYFYSIKSSIVIAVATSLVFVFLLPRLPY